MLSITNLHVRVDTHDILHGLELTVHAGEVHAIMGPNGSGKSTLAHVLAGRDGYEVTAGEVRYAGQDLLRLSPEERAGAGIFLAFQYPVEIPGVSSAYFLRTALNALRQRRGLQGLKARDFLALLKAKMSLVEMDQSLLDRAVNAGFSGGEKKRHEILQMALLRPELAILDETDSGLDVDALRVVAEGVNRMRGPHLGILLITHYTRILRYISPDVVHVMVEGAIVQSGGPELADELEAHGYERWRGDPAA